MRSVEGNINTERCMCVGGEGGGDVLARVCLCVAFHILASKKTQNENRQDAKTQTRLSNSI